MLPPIHSRRPVVIRSRIRTQRGGSILPGGPQLLPPGFGGLRGLRGLRRQRRVKRQNKRMKRRR